MLDLTGAFQEAMHNLQTWRNRYSIQEYPHKIVLNMMYRGYAMQEIFDDYLSGKLPRFSSSQEAIMYMERYYGDVAIQRVAPFLELWVEQNANKSIGGLIYANYDRMASTAELTPSMKEEVEFSYIFDLLQEKCVLYWIALRQTGEDEMRAVGLLTGLIIQSEVEFTYEMTKVIFQDLCVRQFMAQHYVALP